MPDWSIEENYSFTDNLSHEGWAWEFLRRNPKYREDYKAVSQLLNLLVEFYGPLDDPAVNRILEDVPGAFFFEPPLNRGETACEWRKRFKDDEGATLKRIDYHYGWGWGLDGPIQDPFTDEQSWPKFLTTPEWPILVKLEECPNYFENSQYPNLVLVGFNLNLSVKAQSLAIGKVLAKIKDAQRDKGLLGDIPSTGSIKNMKDHLRLLDAYYAGATPNEIGDCLFKHIADQKRRTDTVHDRRKAAERFRDHDYRLIPLRRLKPEK